MKHVRRSVFFGLAALVALPVLPVRETLVSQLVSRIPKTVGIAFRNIEIIESDRILQTLSL